MRCIIFFIFIFLQSSIFIKAQKEREQNEELKYNVENINYDIQRQIDQLIVSLNKYINGDTSVLTSYYLTPSEAEQYTNRLIEENYPGVDDSLTNDILIRSNQIKVLLNSYVGRFSRVVLSRSSYKQGHTKSVEGYIVVLSFGDEKSLFETQSIVLLDYNGLIKFFTLK